MIYRNKKIILCWVSVLCSLILVWCVSSWPETQPWDSIVDENNNQEVEEIKNLIEDMFDEIDEEQVTK